VWVLAASTHYARVEPAEWAERIAAARQAGFNTIETACPWLLHEPRDGRFSFDGQANVAGFIKACAAAGMRVILRIGPFVGGGYDGGGLPHWLVDLAGVKVREANEVFLERAVRFFRKLLVPLVDLQMTKDGPIILVSAASACRSRMPTTSGPMRSAPSVRGGEATICWPI
jgi:beta-galactosidase